MAHLIDTDIAIHLRDGDVETTRRLLQLPEPPLMSIITLVELEGGASATTAIGQLRRRNLDRLLQTVDIIGFDRDVVIAYSRLIGQVGFSRRRVLDRLIAATAIIHDHALVTMNERDFRDIPGLKLEVWPAPAQ